MARWTWSSSLVRFSALLWAGYIISAHAQSQPTTTPAPVCSKIIVPNQHTFPALPPSVQQEIRSAVKPDVLATIHDPGMGIDTKWSEVQLDAVKIGNSGSKLYAVFWRDKQFGVNGAIWIVEVTATGARNLSDSHHGPMGSASGFGIGTLPSSSDQYPKIVVASKGYKTGGGAEAEATCLRKIGDFYEPQPCPATCKENLNSR